MTDVILRNATEFDIDFAFDVKREALGPHVTARWGWDDDYQRIVHEARWRQRPWQIIELEGVPIGTVSIEQTAHYIRFGEFYLLPQHQRHWFGTQVLDGVVATADALGLPVWLEYLKWNPVATLYERAGFRVIDENDTHKLLVRRPPGDTASADEAIILEPVVDPADPTPPRWYALRDAVYGRFLLVAAALLRTTPGLVHMVNAIGETVLHFLAVEDDHEGVQWLHARGGDLDTKNAFGEPLIFEVAALEYKKLFSWFVEAGVDLRAEDNDGDDLFAYLLAIGQDDMADWVRDVDS
ncbi:hypothetical protein BH09PSE6_BH09PSE6_22040 [soil metagenome]